MLYVLVPKLNKPPLKFVPHSTAVHSCRHYKNIVLTYAPPTFSPLCTAGANVTEPESYLKKRKQQATFQAAFAANKASQKAKGKKKRAEIFKRAEKYVKEYRTKEKDVIRFKRQAKAAGNIYKEAEAAVVFAIRIRGITSIAPQTKKILQLLRLRQLNNGVFIKVNKATMTMLRLVEPYVTYGAPNLKAVKNLIYKRGHGKVLGQRIPLTSNKIIEKALGSLDIICVEDLIHEIITVGPNFKAANNFLWPFKLSAPRGGFNKIRVHFSEGGDAGNRAEAINVLIDKMN